MQLTHHHAQLQQRCFDIVLLCDGVNSPANKGGLLRLADSFGVQKVIFANSELDLESPRLKRTARSTQKWVPTEVTKDIIATISNYQEENYITIALEITTQSVPIAQLDFLNLKKILLVIGEENFGVSAQVLEKCHAHAHISMFGKNSSMNVTQASAIALYEITKQLNITH